MLGHVNKVAEIINRRCDQRGPEIERRFLPYELPSFVTLNRGDGPHSGIMEYGEFLKMMERTYTYRSMIQYYIKGEGVGSHDFRIRRIIGKEGGVLSTKIGKGLDKEELKWSVSERDLQEILRDSDFPGIKKSRFYMSLDGERIEREHKGIKVEFDVFEASLLGTWDMFNLKGLIIAEIDVSKWPEGFEFRSWLGKEITSKKGYGNSSIARFGVPSDVKLLLRL
jgi:CYTH domain-containing protein